MSAIVISSTMDGLCNNVIKVLGMSTGCARLGLAFFAVSLCVPIAQAPQSDVSGKNSVTATVPFFVLDNHGNSTDTPVELSVLDNKTSAQSVVAVHRAGELPLRLGVLIDTSNSERKSSLYQPKVQGLSDLLHEVIKKPEDRAFVVSFSVKAAVSPFMNQDELVKFKIDLTPGGGTAIHDAVYVACKERMENDPTQPARRVLVVLSDGGDNLSHVTRDETIAAALKSGTVIFTLSTNENPNSDQDSSRLEQFADKTGGQAFLHLKRTDLRKVVSSIVEQIDSMHTVTFVPASAGKAGEFHSIELKTASDRKTKLRAPKGYYVRATAP